MSAETLEETWTTVADLVGKPVSIEPLGYETVYHPAGNLGIIVALVDGKATPFFSQAIVNKLSLAILFGYGLGRPMLSRIIDRGKYYDLEPDY